MTKNKMGVGLLIVFTLNAWQLVVTVLLAIMGDYFSTLLIGLGGFGIIQWIYVLPMYFHFRNSQRPDTAKGVVIAGSVSTLLNAACWGMVFFRG